MVAKITFVLVLIALATTRECPLYQLDVKNAFFHGDLHEEVYKSHHRDFLVLLIMFVVFVEPSIVSSRLIVHGLRNLILLFLMLASLKSVHNHAMLIRLSPISSTLLLPYVDDMIIACDNPAHI